MMMKASPTNSQECPSFACSPSGSFNARASERAGLVSSKEDYPSCLLGVPFEHFLTFASVSAARSPLVASTFTARNSLPRRTVCARRCHPSRLYRCDSTLDVSGLNGEQFLARRFSHEGEPACVFLLYVPAKVRNKLAPQVDGCWANTAHKRGMIAAGRHPCACQNGT